MSNRKMHRQKRKEKKAEKKAEWKPSIDMSLKQPLASPQKKTAIQQKKQQVIIHIPSPELDELYGNTSIERMDDILRKDI